MISVWTWTDERKNTSKEKEKEKEEHTEMEQTSKKLFMLDWTSCYILQVSKTNIRIWYKSRPLDKSNEYLT